jgi:hypothetical protein
MSEEETDERVKIASDNKLFSDNTNKVSLFNIENDFSGLDKAILCFFPSIRHEMLLRYRAETIAKIGIEAYKIAQNRNILINPIPPKIAMPLVEKMSLEHEPDMYEKWAKLLIAVGANPNPLHQQYADLLYNLDNYSAKFLKNIYINQKMKMNAEAVYDQYIEYSMLNKLYNAINKQFSDRFYALGENNISVSSNSIFFHPPFDFPMIIHGTEKSVLYHWVVVSGKDKDKKINPKDHESPCLSLPEKEKKMLQLLDKLGLIKFQILSYDRNKDSNRLYIERYGVFLTEFGYSFIDCLENPINSETQRNSENDT